MAWIIGISLDSPLTVFIMGTLNKKIRINPFQMNKE